MWRYIREAVDLLAAAAPTLEALTATLAVIAWKKQLGFYADLAPQHHSVYTISTGSLIGEDRP